MTMMTSTMMRSPVPLDWAYAEQLLRVHVDNDFVKQLRAERFGGAGDDQADGGRCWWCYAVRFAA